MVPTDRNMKYFVVSVVVAVLLVCFSLGRYVWGCNHESIQLYNWLPVEEAVSFGVEDMKKYISECSIVVEIDKVDMTYDRSLNTETKLTRVFHVRKVIKGKISPGTCFYDELYPEENMSQAGITTTRYEGRYWLLLKADCVAPCEEGRCYIDRSEAYVYSYFVFGDDVLRLIVPTS